MKQASFTLKGFTGLNNVSRPEALDKTELSTAFNVELTDSNALRRRKGRRSVYQGDCHSLFAADGFLYFRAGDSLICLEIASGATQTMRSGIIGANRMNFLHSSAGLFYSDGIITGVIQSGADRTWGIDAPTAPAVTNTVGDLTPGTYQVAITYKRLDGQESGSSAPVLIRNTSGGLVITGIPQSSDPGVAYVCLYLSPANAATLYLFATMANGTATMAISGGNTGNGFPLQTAFLNAPPCGQLLETRNGRHYIAAGDTLWYTNIYAYELVDYRYNFIQFDGRITMLKALSTGLWVSAGGKSHFLGGDDPASENAPLVIRSSLGYPAIEGTGVRMDGPLVGTGEVPGEVVVWVSKRGICVGTQDGTLLAATEKKFLPPNVSAGVATTIKNGDSSQYVFAMNVGSNGGSLRLPVFRS